jgi:hypothetical protein
MKSMLLFLAVFCTFTALTFAQERSKRQATVVTADDKKYEGIFIKADESGVTIETGDVQTTIKLDTVKMILFSGITPPPTPEVAPVNTKSKEAAQRAVTALRKLNSATGVGVSFVEYGRILIDAKALVDEELPKIEEGQLKTEIHSATIEYAYAAHVWNYFIRNPRGAIPSKSDLGRQLIGGYGVPIKISVFTSIPRDWALTAIWRKAGGHFNRAVELSSR